MDTAGQTQPTQPPMNGDDDLAKVLHEGLQFEETPVPGDTGTVAPPADDNVAPTLTAAPEPVAPPADELPAVHHDHAKKEEPAEPAPTEEVEATHAAAKSGDGDLDKLKMSALEELRPLVGKLDLPAEDKFDTFLLIIRSTDDQSLLDEAHEAAKNISDEKRRAQALLDIVKEIDYFSSKH